MSGLTGSEILELFSKLAPHINSLMPDRGITVVKDGRYINYVPADNLNLGTLIGEKIRYAGAGKQALETGKRVYSVVSREESPYGIPYVACAVPFKDGERVIGYVAITHSVDELEKLNGMAGELAACSQELTAGMEELSAGASEISNVSKELNKLGMELENAAKATDDIVAFIKNIANQTNLLGLNAAIEAARVGDLGRGFGVVADEVRKLATASSNSVKNISECLSTIQNIANILLERIKVIDNTLEEQAASLQESAGLSQNLATMSFDLLSITNTLYNVSD